MNDETKPEYAPGRTPWDPINGLRVGGLAGGIAGAIPTLVLGGGYFWTVLVGAAIGGAVGFWIEKRKAGTPTRL